jgi:hypothetical protein
MKVLLLAAPAIFLASCASVKNSVNKIDEQDVERIIKTLSSDEMEGRATFSKGIDKAATFIEGEFKEAGLEYLPGLKSYRQSFSAYRLKPGNAEVVIDGNTINPENVYVSTDYPGIKWNTDPSVIVKRIKAGETFIPQTAAGRGGGGFPPNQENKPTIVLVDESFKTDFTRARTNAMTRTRNVTQLNTQNPIVYVLTSSGGKSFRVNYTNVIETLPLFNVAGMIPGRSKAKEIVVFSGHFDHLGIRNTGGADSIFNGADDDASGTTAMIELAKYYKKHVKPERTLMFVAFTGEEVGGYGARYFSGQVNPDDVVAMFNIEMIGKDSKFGPNTAFITGYERSDFGEILQKNLEGTDFKFHPDPYPTQNLFYRSDNATLARLGVPAHTISTDQIDTDPYYHKATDEFKTLDVRNILSTIKAIALSSRSIVAGKDTPKRIPKQATGF